jgi:hypothetical protein
VKLVCPDSIRAQDEITINYGDKSNEELLFVYGQFVLHTAVAASVNACPAAIRSEPAGVSVCMKMLTKSLDGVALQSADKHPLQHSRMRCTSKQM